MTGHIIQLPGNPHRDIEALLPWYVTGRLDAADQGRVEAHLGACHDCRAQLDAERRLDRALTRVPADVEAGWATLRRQLDPERRARDTVPPQRAASGERRRPSWTWLGWGLGAQLALISLVGVMVVAPQTAPARFEALSAAAPPPAGNLIVIFRPETSEQELRRTLRASDARLVDGPTAANAYVLEVPARDRDARLAELRRQPQIVLAEPIDAERQR